MSMTYESMVAADEADLFYVSDESPGIRRRRRGKGWAYYAPDGSVITDAEDRARIASIAVPPAWTDVWICPLADGHIQATGRDARGRKQYRYHPRWREVRDANKYDRMATFGTELPRLRRRIDEHLRLPGLPRDRVLALVVRLLDETLIRVGNDEYAATNDSYGLTTLRSEHVEVSGATVQFDFTGKGGLTHEVAVRDRRLAKLVQACSELQGHELFAYVGEDGSRVDVGSSDVNLYLREQTRQPFTAKDFRTWGGTAVAATTLVAIGPATNARQAERNVLEAFDAAAERLNNTRAVCRSCYVHPAVPDAYRTGELFDAWKVARSGHGLDRGERTVLTLLRAKERAAAAAIEAA
jgi:DNA topoisomerase I